MNMSWMIRDRNLELSADYMKTKMALQKLVLQGRIDGRINASHAH